MVPLAAASMHRAHSRTFVVVVDRSMVTRGVGGVVVVVTLSLATPLLLRNVDWSRVVCEPSGLVVFWLRSMLSVPAGGATISGMTMAGVVVVVVVDELDCANAGVAKASGARPTAVAIARLAAETRKRIMVVCPILKPSRQCARAVQSICA